MIFHSNIRYWQRKRIMCGAFSQDSILWFITLNNFFLQPGGYIPIFTRVRSRNVLPRFPSRNSMATFCFVFSYGCNRFQTSASARTILNIIYIYRFRISAPQKVPLLYLSCRTAGNRKQINLNALRRHVYTFPLRSRSVRGGKKIITKPKNTAKPMGFVLTMNRAIVNIYFLIECNALAYWRRSDTAASLKIIL